MTGPYRDRTPRDLDAAYDDAVGDVWWEGDPPEWADEEWDDDPEDWAEWEEPADEDPFDEDGDGERSRAGLWLKIGAVAVAVLLVAAVVVGLTRSGGRDDTVRDPAGARSPAVPAQLPRQGAYVESRILESGDIEVDQWIREPEPIRQLTLQAPEPADAQATVAAPEASHVVAATVDGGRLPAPSVVGTVPQVVALPRPSRTVHLTYRLQGVVDTNSGSATGRALARVTSLDVDYAPVSGPVRVAVVGSGVLNLACSARSAPLVLPEPCGAPHGNGWQVLLTGARRGDRVSAQLNSGYSASADGASGGVVRAADAAGPARTR